MTVEPGRSADDDQVELVEHYDRQYADGGFGYENQRETWKAWVADHYVREFELQPGDRLLDVGCGDGFWTGLFAEAGLVATGMDLSPGGIEVARRAHPGVEFVVGNAEEVPFPDESFDIVFCRAISHLSRRDLSTPASARLVTEMTRLLRPGGILLISYYTRRDGGGTPEHAWHRVSDLLRLIEPVADPFHVDVVGHYVQIGAQRWDAPRRRRRTARPSAAPTAVQGQAATAPQRLRRGLGRLRRNLGTKRRA